MNKDKIGLKRHLSTIFTSVGTAAIFFCLTSGTRAWGDSLNDWLNQSTMTGNWGGVRTNLEQEGINIFGSFGQQFGDDVIGGKQQGFDYDQQIVLGVDFDLQKLLGLNGAIIHFVLNDRAGRNISSDDVGDVQELYGLFGAGENFHMQALTYEQKLFHNRVNLLIGYYSSGNEFAFSPVLCHFATNALCGHPFALPADTKGFFTAPDAQLGGRIKIYVTPSTYFMTGLFDVNPPISGTDDNGFKFGLVNSTGAIELTEIGQQVSLGPSHLIGHYKIGGYYDSSVVADVANPKVLESGGRYGGYAIADQMIYSLNSNSSRGLIVFANASINDKRTSLVESFYGAGFVFLGPFSQRPFDSFNFGWAKSDANKLALNAAYENAIAKNDPLFGLENAEQLFEINYNFQIAPWLSVRPTVDYVLNPGALHLERFPDAWVFGAQTGVTF
jgi:porin